MNVQCDARPFGAVALALSLTLHTQITATADIQTIRLMTEASSEMNSAELRLFAKIVPGWRQVKGLEQCGITGSTRVSDEAAKLLRDKIKSNPGQFISNTCFGQTRRGASPPDDDRMIGPGTGQPGLGGGPKPRPGIGLAGATRFLSNTAEFDGVPFNADNLIAAQKNSNPPNTSNQLTADMEVSNSPPMADDVLIPSLAPKKVTNRLRHEPTCSVNASASGSPCSLFAVFIITKNFQCSGTLISQRHVLTAAHCVEDLADGKPVGVNPDFKHLRVLLGSSYGGGNGDKPQFAYRLAVDEAVSVECYTLSGETENFCNTGGGGNGDIALLTLKSGDLNALWAFFKDEGFEETFRENFDRIIVDVANFESRTLLDGVTATSIETISAKDLGKLEVLAIGSGADTKDPDNKPQTLKHTARMLIDPTSLRYTSQKGAMTLNIGNLEVGLCQGDSGGGVFRRIEGARKSGHDDVAIIGVISGVGKSGECAKEGDTFAYRSFVSLGSEEIRSWLQDKTNGELRFSKTAVGWPAPVAN